MRKMYTRGSLTPLSLALNDGIILGLFYGIIADICVKRAFDRTAWLSLSVKDTVKSLSQPSFPSRYLDAGPCCPSSLPSAAAVQMDLSCSALSEGSVEWCACVRAQWNMHVCVHILCVCNRVKQKCDRKGKTDGGRRIQCLFDCETAWVIFGKSWGESNQSETQHVVVWWWNLHLFCIFMFVCHASLCALSYVKIKCDLYIFCPPRQAFLTESRNRVISINKPCTCCASQFFSSMPAGERGGDSHWVCLRTELDLCKALTHQ